VRAYVWGVVSVGGLVAGVGGFIAKYIPHWVGLIVGIGSLVVGAVYIWYGSWIRSLYDDYCRPQGVYISQTPLQPQAALGVRATLGDTLRKLEMIMDETRHLRGTSWPP
jgi:hypothetical protein